MRTKTVSDKEAELKRKVDELGALRIRERELTEELKTGMKEMGKAVIEGDKYIASFTQQQSKDTTLKAFKVVLGETQAMQLWNTLPQKTSTFLSVKPKA